MNERLDVEMLRISAVLLAVAEVSKLYYTASSDPTWVHHTSQSILASEIWDLSKLLNL